MRVAPLLLMLLLAGAAPAPAQQPASPGLFAALGVGMTWLPDPLVESCGSGGAGFPAVEARAGVRRSGWGAVARATAFGHLATESCATIWPVHEAGTHTDDVYPYDRGHGGTALSLQLQHWPGDGPLAVGAGAGWLASDEVPFALLSVGARTRGAPALFAEVEGWVSRLRYDRVTARWSRFEVVEELERTGHSAWNRSLSVRVGAHFPLF